MKEHSYGIIPYRFNDGIEILLYKSSKNSLWNFPKGKIEIGESPIECVKREMKEELFIGINEELLQDPITIKGKNKDITLYFYHFTHKISQWDKREIYKLKWFKLWDLPELSKNQRLFLTEIYRKLEPLDFLLKGENCVYN